MKHIMGKGTLCTYYSLFSYYCLDRLIPVAVKSFLRVLQFYYILPQNLAHIKINVLPFFGFPLGMDGNDQ